MVKHCPNPECLYGRDARVPGEFRDDIGCCPTCGSDLAPGAPDTRKQSNGLPLLVSAAAGISLYLLQYIPLPASSGIEAIDLPGGGTADLVVLPQSFATILGCFVVVEIAAWIVPPWRRLRQTGPTGRGKLNRAAVFLAVSFGAVQALGIALYLRSYGEIEGASALFLWPLSGAAATATVFWIAHLVDRYGLGKGWSLPVLVMFVDVMILDFRYSLDAFSDLPVLFGVIAVVLTLLTIWILQTNASQNSDWPLLPTTGLVPLLPPCLFATNLVLNMIERYPLSIHEGDYDLNPRNLLYRMVIVLALGVLCHRTYVGGAAGSRSLTVSLVFLAVITIAQHVLTAREFFVMVPTWIVSVAIVHDLVREGRFRRKHGELVSIASVDRLADLPRILAALNTASVPATTPGYGHRVMLRFFAPYVPVDIAVPVDRERVARKILSAED